MFRPQITRRHLPGSRTLLAGGLALLGGFATLHTATAAGDPCTLPGTLVVSDPTGDQNAGGNAEQDIQSISIAELGADANTLTFTMKVADLNSVPPNTSYRIEFTPASGGIRFVSMDTDPTSTVTYSYGTDDGTSQTTVGAADAGSFTADGTIHIKIANNKIGNPAAGQPLANVNGVTSMLVGAGGSGLLLTVDSTSNGTYTLVGNAACAAGGTPTPTPSGTATPTPPPTGGGTAGMPRFQNYVAPPGSGDDSGEPSLGVNWQSEKKFSNSLFADIPNGGTALYFGGFSPYMLRITFDDCSSPATATWEQKPLLSASTPRAAGDPILFTDHDTGRTFVSQLEGLTPAGSTTDITDNDGDSFLPSEGSDLPSDVDHQTFGGGPFAPPLTGTVYPHAVYYASQSVAEARAAVSVDGGFTFNEGNPMYTAADCAGLHGHIKVAPDGTMYVPNKACGGDVPFHDGSTDGRVGNASVAVSTDDATTFTVRQVPNAPTRVDDDPSVGVASDGTIYLGWQSADGHPRIAVSHDKGATWSTPVDVGASVTNGGPVLNTTFPAVVAGDPDRAAFAFYGSETGGDNYHCGEGEDCSPEPPFPGVWYLYVASTFDGGRTWTTQNVTPGDPIQRGGICGGGTCRNLLDFFDIQVDKEGRVLVGWDDGCIGACVQAPPNSYSTKATITRQSGGKRLFAAFDPAEPVLPGAPGLSGTVDAANTAVTLTWPVPDNGGAPITGYNVYRRIGDTGGFTKIGTVPETTFTDRSFDKTAKNYYHVTAINSVGEGPFCQDILPVVGVAESPCVLPGLLIASDINQDGTDADAAPNVPPDPSLNVRQVFIAEPDLGPGVNQLIFTMQVGQNGTVLPNSEWYIIWNRLHPDADFDRYYVAMRSDATGAITYEYGKFGVPTDTSGNPPSPSTNQPVKLGDVDKGTYDPITGVIQITLSTSKAENAQPGQSLNGVEGRIFSGHADQNPRGVRNQSISQDFTVSTGNYIIQGNAACILNRAPIASLTASPTKGRAPLTVNFDASGSNDPDAGDSIASYTFSFGDGSDEVTQNVPTVAHTYTGGGAFFATVRVKDSHGLISSNVASLTIKTNSTLLNISTRLRVQTDANVAIGGFIINGTASKKVILRGIGPSLQANGQPVAGRLEDPVLELHDKSGAVIAENDNWKDKQQAEIQASGIPPADDRESAIVATLPPGEYTAILRGKDNSSGIGLVEIYDLDRSVDSQLVNLSTRGFVETGDNVMIGGFVAGGANAAGVKAVLRALGPSLGDQVPNALADPTLELRSQNGDLIASNDNWKETQQAEIAATGLAPKNDAESAIFVNDLEPGPYTAIVRGKNASAGVGLVEIYNLQ